MFERFTDRARRAIMCAQEEARLLNHNYIGTEHVLLGLLSAGGGAAAAIEGSGLSLERARAAVVDIIGKGDQAPSDHIPFTPRAKKVLELSLREALQLGHKDIRAEHILLGLLREGEGVAVQVLVSSGITTDALRAQVLSSLSAERGMRRAEEAAAAEVIPLHGAVGPNCARCGGSFEANAQLARITAAEDGGKAREILVVVCPTCGAVLGTLNE